MRHTHLERRRMIANSKPGQCGNTAGQDMKGLGSMSRTTVAQARNMIDNLNRLTGRPQDRNEQGALFLIDRGSDYPYRYSVGVCGADGSEDYFMGGTGRFFKVNELIAYLHGALDVAESIRYPRPAYMPTA